MKECFCKNITIFCSLYHLCFCKAVIIVLVFLLLYCIFWYIILSEPPFHCSVFFFNFSVHFFTILIIFLIMFLFIFACILPFSITAIYILTLVLYSSSSTF
uniref:Uncharacterized protein n=1 Tax=Octopus bimaculoides TaxID=37653 RepID=A0A0L8HP70_OCTBM